MKLPTILSPESWRDAHRKATTPASQPTHGPEQIRLQEGTQDLRIEELGRVASESGFVKASDAHAATNRAVIEAGSESNTVSMLPEHAVHSDITKIGDSSPAQNEVVGAAPTQAQEVNTPTKIAA